MAKYCFIHQLKNSGRFVLMSSVELIKNDSVNRHFRKSFSNAIGWHCVANLNRNKYASRFR